jgi:hypothetical protein
MGSSTNRPISQGACTFLVLAGFLLMTLAALPTPAQAAVVTVSASAPAGNETFSGGSPHDIVWFMDTDSGNPSLSVDFEYLLDGVPTTIVTGSAYPAGTPSAHSWDVPAIDHANVTVRVCASDLAGGSACDTTPAFRIDSTRPDVLSNSPAGTNVGPFEEIVVDFSELMNDTSLPPAFSIAPSVSGINITTYKSTSTTTAMRVNHSDFVFGARPERPGQSPDLVSESVLVELPHRDAAKRCVDLARGRRPMDRRHGPPAAVGRLGRGGFRELLERLRRLHD